MIDYIDKDFYTLCESIQNEIDAPVHLYKDFEMLEGIKPIRVSEFWSNDKTYYVKLDFPYPEFDVSYMIIYDEFFQSLRQQVYMVLNISNNSIKEIVIIDKDALLNRNAYVNFAEFKKFSDRYWISSKFFETYNLIESINTNVKISVGIVNTQYIGLSTGNIIWNLENIQSNYLAALSTPASKKSKLANIGAYLIKPKKYIINNKDNIFVAYTTFIPYNVLANIIYPESIGELPIQYWKMPNKKKLIFISGPDAPAQQEVLINESFSFDNSDDENNDEFYTAEFGHNLKDYELFFQKDGLFEKMSKHMTSGISSMRENTIQFKCVCGFTNDKTKIVCYSTISKEGLTSTYNLPIMAIDPLNLKRLYLIESTENDPYRIINYGSENETIFPYIQHFDDIKYINEHIINNFNEIAICSYKNIFYNNKIVNANAILTNRSLMSEDDEQMLEINRFKSNGTKLYFSTFSFDEKDTCGMDASDYDSATFDCGLFGKITPINIDDKETFKEMKGFCIIPFKGGDEAILKRIEFLETI